ncbi:protein phosphatase 2C domain-containing protein [Streptomyces sp. GS7]|uniref:protein phosphatase 2C domain-containing protein n=1 Tax=Streptomyces sp. GS7 TaxID=2692234 RepID=UPI0013163913|nr:protein phosphatase 2C domain-containing protein [Streptomyces sp. GS7]QHC21038.1 protein phosphatase [Streptomyces sp. GS7]
MGVTGPSRCRSCDELLDTGDNFCGRCGAELLTPAAAGDGRPDGPPVVAAGGYGAPAGREAAPAAAYGAPTGFGPPAGAAAPAGPPPPDPKTRIPYGDAGAPPVPGQVPAAPDARPADPRVVGYEAVADAAAGAEAEGEGEGEGESGGEAGGEAEGNKAEEREEAVAAPGGARPAAGEDASSREPAGTAPRAAGVTAAPAETEATAEAEAEAAWGGKEEREEEREQEREREGEGAPAPGGSVDADADSGPDTGPDTGFGAAADAPPEAPSPAPSAPGRQRDHLESELAGIAAVSDRGHRHHRNEDFYALAATELPDGSPAVVAVVCDGVSSATRPDDASKAASETAGTALRLSLVRGTHPQQAMHEAIMAASAAVDALAADPSIAHDEYRQQNAPACTFVGAVVGGGLLTVGWVGDSRAYWIPDDRTAPPVRLTEDDSWAAQMVANNLMTEAEANADERAHAITGWLGADAYEVEPHTAVFKPDGPGIVVVCTDGLWNYAESADAMAAVLPLDAPVRPLHGARTLVAHALGGGGHDNVTVALVPFPAPTGGAGSA